MAGTQGWTTLVRFLSEIVMGNESGTWIMYGVEPDDPECIHTVDEAIEYINKILQSTFLFIKYSDLEKYSRGRRGAPAKGIGRVTGARVQIPPSPLKKR